YHGVMNRVNRWQHCRVLCCVVLLASLPQMATAAPLLRLSRHGRIGRRLLIRKRWAAAAAEFQLAVDRGHPVAAEWEGRGYARLKAGQFSEAAAAYERLSQRYCDRASFWINLGLADAYREPAHLE